MKGVGQAGRHAFTRNFGKCVNEIILPVEVGKPGSELYNRFMGVWDTGATNTVISQKIIDVLGLVDIVDEVDTHSADGPGKADAYYVHVLLPNGVHFSALRVLKMNIREDLLIGMDIIGVGDSCLTNKNGKTVLTYEWPAYHQYDFVKQVNSSKKHSPPRLNKKR